MEKKQYIVCHNLTDPKDNTIMKCLYCERVSYPDCIASWLLIYNAYLMCQNKFLFPNLMLIAR